MHMWKHVAEINYIEYITVNSSTELRNAWKYTSTLPYFEPLLYYCCVNVKFTSEVS
jgi:hypothetical protein